jgi:hypothetical protein
MVDQIEQHVFTSGRSPFCLVRHAKTKGSDFWPLAVIALSVPLKCTGSMAEIYGMCFMSIIRAPRS